MITQFKKRMRDRVWQIWESSKAFTDLVSAANRQKVNEEDGWLAATMMQSKAADLPQVKLEEPRTVNSAWEEMNTFDTEDDEFPTPQSSGTVRWTFTMSATFLSADLDLDQQDALVDIAQIALLDAGPTLKVPNVFTTGPFECQQTEVGKNIEAGTRRLKTVMTFPIVAVFEIRELLQT